MTARIGDVSGSAFTTETANRKPWAAAALSVAVAGLGHLYVGRPLRGALAFLFVAVGSVSGIAAATSLRGMVQLAAYTALIVAVYGAPTLDAYLIAARIPDEYRL